MSFNSIFRHSLLGCLFLITGISNAQETNLTVEAYLLQNNQLFEVSSASNSQLAIAVGLGEEINSLSTGRVSVEGGEESYVATTQAQMSKDQATVYLLKTFTDESGNSLTDARLVSWDRFTNEVHVLYDQHGVIQFFAAPDMATVIVFYYSGEFENSKPAACLLTVKTRSCNPVRFGDFPIGQTAYWINNKEVVLVAASHHPLYLLNAINGELENLAIPEISGGGEWYLGGFNIIHGTRTLVASANLRTNPLYAAPVFFTIDIDTMLIQPLPYSADDLSKVYGVPTLTFVDTLTVSPDGNYLFYRSGEHSTLVELRTGRLISSFRGTGGSLWINDQTLLVQAKETQLELLQVNAPTAEIIVVATDQAASGLLLSSSNPCAMSPWNAC